MIDDNELRALFQAESDEHLQSLDEGLLALEADPADAETLQRIFRDAHSLKGSARMLGIAPVEQVAHRFEDVLGAARRGEVALTAPVITKLYETLDTIRALVQEAVTGVSARVNVAEVLAGLDAVEQAEEGDSGGSEAPVLDPPAADPVASEQAAPSAPELPDPVVVAEDAATDAAPPVEREALPAPTPPPPTEAPSPPAQQDASARPSDAFRVETIRVDSRKLDDLMLRAGELVVTNGRIEQRAGDVATVNDRWTSLYRELLAADESLGSSASDLPDGRRRVRAEQAYGRMRDLADDLQTRIEELKEDTGDDRTRLDKVVSRIEEGIRSASLLPLSTVFGLFPRMIRDLALAQDKELALTIEGADTTVDKRIIEQLKDPLMHLIRNSADHGIEAGDDREAVGKPREGAILLRASQSATLVTIDVIDDGGGVDSGTVGRKAVERGLVTPEDLDAMPDDQIRELIFAAGFSTSAVITDRSGRGVGLDVVRSAIDSLRGSVSLRSTPGEGSRFRIQLPVTLATSRVLVVRVSGIHVAFPMDTVSRVRLVSHDDISLIESQGTIDIEGEVLPLAPLWHLLELERPEPGVAASEGRPCVVVRVNEQAFGVFVDHIEGIQEVLLTTRESLLKRVRNIAGSTILTSGVVCFVLNAMDLLATMHGRARRGASALPKPAEMLPAAEEKTTILIAEDSITTRTQIARVLGSAGYEVIVSVDGADALEKLAANAVDALVSDVEMPNLDGIGLTRAVRQNPDYEELPIVLVTSLASDEHRARGADAGANAYITKGGFDQRVLLETLERLI